MRAEDGQGRTVAARACGVRRQQSVRADDAGVEQSELLRRRRRRESCQAADGGAGGVVSLPVVLPQLNVGADLCAENVAAAPLARGERQLSVAQERFAEHRRRPHHGHQLEEEVTEHHHLHAAEQLASAERAGEYLLQAAVGQ